tara:strand:+ start:654 stop:941 length:288 start_codon:yes stop_codon:yes gene_type:complete
MSNYNYYNINWEHEVIEYKAQYDDDDYIVEYVESMLPIYYGDIYTTYHQVIGTPLNIEIEQKHVGQTIDKIMNWHIFEEYMIKFMAEFNEYEEEE